MPPEVRHCMKTGLALLALQTPENVVFAYLALFEDELSKASFEIDR